MQINKIIIGILSVILILIVLFFARLTLMTGTKMNKNSIIKKYEENQERFDTSMKELTEEYIYFNRENLAGKKGDIVITIHKHKEDGTADIITIEKNDYTKYEKTLELMEKLDIVSISKHRKNIAYQCNAMIGFSQEIVQLTDEEDYVKSGSKITYKEDLGNGWYYIENE